MAFPRFTPEGKIHPCFYYLRELENCRHEHIYWKRVCHQHKNNFVECHRRKKLKAFMSAFQAELVLTQVVNVPHYDKENDRFVFDDGQIVSNTDPMFTKFKWM